LCGCMSDDCLYVSAYETLLLPWLWSRWTVLQVQVHKDEAVGLCVRTISHCRCSVLVCLLELLADLLLRPCPFDVCLTTIRTR
jgi:hypothetical protein